MPNRSYTAGTQFRYGFNGKENDNDVKGTGNQQDYGMRIYDPRIGKFLSVDPLCKKFPFYSPYHYAGNSPILNIDLDGAEPLPTNPVNGQQAIGDNTGEGLSPANGFVSIPKGSKVLYQFVDEGKKNGVKAWIPVSFKTPEGELYKWNQAKEWYSTDGGKEFDQAFYNDVTDWGFRNMGKVLTSFFGNALEGDPFKDVEAAYDNYQANGGGSVGGFLLNGIKNSVANSYGAIKSGGHKRLGALIGIWNFTSGLASGSLLTKATAPIRAGALVPLSEEVFTQGLAQELMRNPMQVGAYSLFGNQGLVGKTFNVNIFYMTTTSKSLSGFNTVLKSLEANAIKAGANSISIYGAEVVNKGFLNPASAARYGYTFEKIGNGVIFQKLLVQ